MILIPTLPVWSRGTGFKLGSQFLLFISCDNSDLYNGYKLTSDFPLVIHERLSGKPLVEM